MKQYSAVTFLCRFTFAFIVAVGAISLSSCHDDSDEPDTIVPEVPDSVGPDKPDTTSSRKTLFMYYPWSTNLTEAFKTNIEDMEEAISNRGLDDERVVVFISTSSSEAEMFEITCKDGKCTRTELKTYENTSFTTVAGLTGIFNDMKSFAPADVYSMIIGCHGMGWVPVESQSKAMRLSPAFVPHYNADKGYAMTRYFGGTTSNYQTDISTLADALNAAGLDMEFILFDDCYMSSVEVAYDLRHVTDHIIACPTEIMAYGMPYAMIGASLLGEPDYQSIAQGFYNFYSSYVYPYGTLGITDCSQIDALAEIMKEINSRYKFDASQLDGLQRMDGYSPVLFFDLGDYVEHLCPDEALLAEFKARLARAVPYAVHTDQYYSAYCGVVDIHAYSGITTSEPSENSMAADVKNTNWYKATH